MKTEDKHKISTLKSIEYIIDYIGARIWIKKDPPKIPIKNIGNKVLVLRSDVGSGKSTVLPTFLYNKFFEEHGIKKNICVTQPTVATTIEIPFDIAKWNKNIKMGENIGYQTGSLVKKPIKGIAFMTVGILLQQLKTLEPEAFMKKYAFIIIDEVHLRSLESDVTLFYLKQLLSANYDNPECPFLILTSGTFDPKPLMNYFNSPPSGFLAVTGFSYPITDNYAPYNVPDYIEYISDSILARHIENVDDIINNDQFRDIIIFMPGGKAIKTISERVHRLNYEVFRHGLKYSKKYLTEKLTGKSLNESKKPNNNKPINKPRNASKSPVRSTSKSPVRSSSKSPSKNTRTASKSPKKSPRKGGKAKSDEKTNEPGLFLLPITLMSANIKRGGEEYRALYSPVDTLKVPIYKFEDGKMLPEILDIVPVSRRIMCGSNAIETGITISSLKYCIDSGLSNEVIFNPNFACTVICEKPVTHASVRQRRGRVGRNAPGQFFACYTKETFDSMVKFPFSDIVKADISSFILDLIIQKTESKIEEIPIDEKKQYIDDIDKPSKNKKSRQIFQMNQVDQRYYRFVSDGIFDAASLDFLQYPTTDGTVYSLEKLYLLGFINRQYSPTILGMFASKFRKLSLESTRMILAGYEYGANILDLITIACMVGNKDIGTKGKMYERCNPLNLDEKSSEYYSKMLFADDFIENLFLYHEFLEAIGELGKSIERNTNKKREQIIDINYMNNWASQRMVSLEALYGVCADRDELIVGIRNIGLSVSYNSLGIPAGSYNIINILRNNLAEGMQEINKIKRCIYEGYRLNYCKWDKQKNAYVAQKTNVKVGLNTPLCKAYPLIDPTTQTQLYIRPKNIIVGNIALGKSRNDPTLFEFNGTDVCVLDGHVTPDLSFIYN